LNVLVYHNIVFGNIVFLFYVFYNIFFVPLIVALCYSDNSFDNQRN
jgi:hypothetical protein